MVQMVSSATPGALGEAIDRGEAYVIDVRTPVEFREIHVASAINIPLDRFDPAEVKKQVPDRATPYIICRSGGRGKMACEKALEAGWTAVANVEGGTLACAESGLSVVRGQKAISLERQVRIVAGGIVLAASLAALLVDPRFAGISAFVGAGLVFAGVTDTCGMGMVLSKMPWNQVAATSCRTD